MHAHTRSYCTQNNGDDITCLVFWLYNTTVWLHLLQCDEDMQEACELLGCFEMLEDVINSVFGTESLLSMLVYVTEDISSFHHPVCRAQNRPSLGPISSGVFLARPRI